jgi:hypothetical protein
MLENRQFAATLGFNERQKIPVFALVYVFFPVLTVGAGKWTGHRACGDGVGLVAPVCLKSISPLPNSHPFGGLKLGNCRDLAECPCRGD